MFLPSSGMRKTSRSLSLVVCIHEHQAQCSNAISFAKDGHVVGNMIKYGRKSKVPILTKSWLQPDFGNGNFERGSSAQTI